MLEILYKCDAFKQSVLRFVHFFISCNAARPVTVKDLIALVSVRKRRGLLLVKLKQFSQLYVRCLALNALNWFQLPKSMWLSFKFSFFFSILRRTFLLFEFISIPDVVTKILK